MYKLYKCSHTDNIGVISHFMDCLLSFFSTTLPHSFNNNPVEWLYTYPPVNNILTLENGDTSPFVGDGTGTINFPSIVDTSFRYIYVKLKNHPRPMFFFVSNRYYYSLSPKSYNLRKTPSLSSDYSIFVSLGLYSFVSNDQIIYYPQGLRVCKERPLISSSSYGYSDYKSASINVFPFQYININYSDSNKRLYFCYNENTFVILSNNRGSTHYKSDILFYISPKNSVKLSGHEIIMDYVTTYFDYFYNKDYMDGYLFKFSYSGENMPCAMNVTIDANIEESVVAPAIISDSSGSYSIYQCSAYSAQELMANPEKRIIYDKIKKSVKKYKEVMAPNTFLSVDRLGSIKVGDGPAYGSRYVGRLPSVYPTMYESNPAVKLGMNVINYGANTLNNHFNVYPALVYVRREPLTVGSVSVLCKAPLLYYCETDFLSDDSAIEYDTFCGKFLIFRNGGSKDFAILVESKEG